MFLGGLAMAQLNDSQLRIFWCCGTVGWLGYAAGSAQLGLLSRFKRLVLIGI